MNDLTEDGMKKEKDGSKEKEYFNFYSNSYTSSCSNSNSPNKSNSKKPNTSTYYGLYPSSDLKLSNLTLPKIENIITLSFDNEIGQIVETEFPQGKLDKSILKLLSIKGFPETNQLSHEGEFGYIFKVRINTNTPFSCLPVKDHIFLFCYVLFIQVKNKSEKRGYIQKSVVLTSKTLSKNIFFKLAYMLRQKIFETNIKLKEIISEFYGKFNQFSDELEKTQKLESESMTEKNLKNNFINFEKVINNLEENLSFVNLQEKTEETKENDNNRKLFRKNSKTSNEDKNYHSNFFYCNKPWKEIINLSLNQFEFNNFFQVFSLFYVAKLWQIWELIILEYPIIVYSDNASRVSSIIFLLESITKPIPLNSDIRPYFSIYDNEFKDYKEEKDLKYFNSTILGVINPIFLKLIPDWPVVIRLDEYFFTSDYKKKIPESPLINPLSPKLLDYYDSKIKSSEFYEIKSFMKKTKSFSLKGNAQLVSLFLDCIKTQGESCYDKLNFHLRAHFNELTRDFMKTIDDFVLLNEIKEIRRHFLTKKREIAVSDIFNKEKFITYLKKKSEKNAFNYKYIHDKKKLITLYENYIKTKNFRNHLNRLLDEIRQEENEYE